MPLSEHEQRLLDQIERALYAEDPKFVSTVRGGRLRKPTRRRRLQGIAVFALHDFGKTIFWIFGLLLCVFVGPAQSASRSLLARVTPAGREGEIFGLYATTGRAASFLSPVLWGAFITIFGAVHFGVLGIVIVLALGLVLMLFVKVAPKAA